MKRVVLLRHGKSDWDADYGTDRDRPLAARGIRAAEAVGRFLAAAKEVPQRLVSSPAVRARRTVELASEAGGWDLEVETVASLYGGGVQAVLQTLRRQPEQVESVLLAGHEPTWSLAASQLVGGGELRVPTACLVVIDLQVSRWEQVDRGCGELQWLLPPRLLGAIED